MFYLMVPTQHYSDRNKERSEATRVFYGVETVVDTVLQVKLMRVLTKQDHHWSSTSLY